MVANSIKKLSLKLMKRKQRLSQVGHKKKNAIKGGGALLRRPFSAASEVALAGGATRSTSLVECSAQVGRHWQRWSQTIYLLNLYPAFQGS